LKINKEYLEDHQVKIIVELDPEPLERAKHQAARSISRKTKIPGFRPGKAPYHVIERTVGESTILENALDILIEDIYPKVIEESGIHPYGPGTLDNMPSLDPPIFEFIVPLDAEVKLGDYESNSYPI
jgi:trigger factor